MTEKYVFLIDVITSIKSMKRWVLLRKSVMLRFPSRPACEMVQGIYYKISRETPEPEPGVSLEIL